MKLASSLLGSLPEGIGDWLPRQAWLSAAIITATALAAPSAMAGPVLNPDGSLLFLYSINGGADPSPPGTAPWLKALITQDGSNAVNIALTTNLGGGGYAISWGFNMKPQEINFPSSAFTYTCISSGKDVCAGMGPSSYIWNPDNVNMQNGWSGFDMKFDLPNNMANRLDDGTTLNIKVSRSGITPGAFNYPVVGDLTNGEFTAVHVGGYGPNYSTTLLDNPTGDEVSAPAPVPILGAVAAFKASRRLRRRLKPAAAAARRSA